MDKNFDGLIAENNRRGEQIVSLQDELARARETIEIVAAQRNAAFEAVEKLREAGEGLRPHVYYDQWPNECDAWDAALASTEPATVDLPKCGHCGSSCGTDCDGSSHYTPDGT